MVDLYTVEILPSVPPKARLIVAGMSTDTDDARILLDMLGLHEDASRFPSFPMPPRAGGTRAPQGPRAPLPSSGYGAVVGPAPVEQRPLEHE